MVAARLKGGGGALSLLVLLSCSLALATTTLVPGAAAAPQQVYTWTGGAGHSDFLDPDNWEPTGVPGPADGAIITTSWPPPVVNRSTSVGHLGWASPQANLSIAEYRTQLSVGAQLLQPGAPDGGILEISDSASFETATAFRVDQLACELCVVFAN